MASPDSKSDPPSLGPSIDSLAEGQKVFDRYTLMKVIGHGQMSVVWLAWDDSKEHDAALKFLPEMVKPDPTALANLKREVQKLQELQNDQIVIPYGVESEGSLVAIASPHIEGTTLPQLREEIGGKVFSPPELSDWLVQLCEVLEYAHEEGWGHGDLKSGNLMADQKGRLRVTDFGMERHLVEFVKKTSEFPNAARDLRYLSPQQATEGGAPTVIDEMYSLGATLYELLTSKPPFYAGNILLQVEQKVPPPMTHRRKEIRVIGEPISRIWEETVAACLSKDPAQRPQSVQELFDMLELERPISASGESIDQVSPETIQVAAPPKGLKKVYAIVAGLVFLTIAIVVFNAGRSGNKNRQVDLAYKEAEETRKATEEERLKAEQEMEAKRRAAEAEAERIKAEASALAEQQREEAAKAQKKLDELRALQDQLEQDRMAKIRAEEKAKSQMQSAQSKEAVAELEKARQERLAAEEAARRVREEAEKMKAQADAELAAQQRKIEEAKRLAEQAEKERIAAEKQAAMASKEAEAQRSALSEKRMEEERVRLAMIAAEEKRKQEAEMKRLEELRQRREEAARMAREAELAEKRYAPDKAFWFNSIGLKFIKSGNIHLGVVEVRQGDWEIFSNESGYDAGRGWRSPGFRQDSSHPVVNISWQDAKAFCDWLTRKEKEAGILNGYHYRLPTDLEWSAAVGLPTESGTSPLTRDSQIKGTYPWGTEFPPPAAPGNYDDAVTYDDYPNTAPVGSFAPNAKGFHDLGGNVWEWTEDWGDSSKSQRVLRGGSWFGYLSGSMLSSYRRFLAPSERRNDQGFRLAIAPDGN